MVDFLFGGSDESSTSRTTYPDWVIKGGKRAFRRAHELAERPYQVYGGPRVAGLSGNEEKATAFARNQLGRSNKMVNQGFQMAREAGRDTWDVDAAKQYMNPFIKRALNPVIRRINEEAQQNAIGTRAGQIIGGGVGAFGDARTAVLEGELEEARLRGIGDTLATGYADAYSSALSAFGRDRDATLRAADLMGTQGGRSHAVSSGQVSDLIRTGANQRGVEQASLDTAYQDFLEQRDWDERGLNYYIAALQGVPLEQETKTSGNTGSSLAQQLAGVGVAAAGMADAGLFGRFFGG